jgi:hypothetical protein
MVDKPRNDNEKILKRQLLQRHKYFQFIFATAAAHELCHTFVGYINRGGYFGHLGTPPEASHLDYGFEPNQTQRSRGMRARGESGRYIEGILYGGSVEYFNEEPGAVWIKRVIDVYPKCVWLNPEPEEIWPYRQSIGILKELMNGRMYPTTLEGLERAMRVLAK